MEGGRKGRKEGEEGWGGKGGAAGQERVDKRKMGGINHCKKH